MSTLPSSSDSTTPSIPPAVTVLPKDSAQPDGAAPTMIHPPVLEPSVARPLAADSTPQETAAGSLPGDPPAAPGLAPAPGLVPAPGQPSIADETVTIGESSFVGESLRVGEISSGGNAPSPAGEPSLTARVARGMAWGLFSTVGGKLIGVLAQLLLAKLLIDKDFALIALAYSVSTFTNLLREVGISQVLVARGEHFDRLSNAAFWMSLILGFVSGGILAGAAPVAAHVYHRPELVGLLLWLALTSPVFALATVPLAKLQVEMRFGMLVVQGLGFNTLIYVLNIVLAWRGYGAYSFIYPLLWVNMVRVAFYWYYTRPKLSWRLDLHLWKEIFLDSGWLFAAGIMVTLMGQGDYMMLGLFHNDQVVGSYFFAFGLSMQTPMIVYVALSGVLLPAFSRLKQDVPRQIAAMLRGSRLIALVATPLCVLQALLADPALRLVFGDKWVAAIVPLQILSLGVAGAILTGPSTTLLQAQERFRGYFLWQAASTAVFLTIVGLCARLGAAVAVSVGVAGFNLVIGSLALRWVAGRELAGWRTIFRLAGVPALIAMAAALPALAAIRMIGGTIDHRLPLLFGCLVGGSVFTGVYLMLAWLVARNTSAELVRLIRTRGK